MAGEGKQLRTNYDFFTFIIFSPLMAVILFFIVITGSKYDKMHHLVNDSNFSQKVPTLVIIRNSTKPGIYFQQLRIWHHCY